MVPLCWLVVEMPEGFPALTNAILEILKFEQSNGPNARDKNKKIKQQNQQNSIKNEHTAYPAEIEKVQQVRSLALLWSAVGTETQKCVAAVEQVLGLVRTKSAPRIHALNTLFSTKIKPLYWDITQYTIYWEYCIRIFTIFAKQQLNIRVARSIQRVGAMLLDQREGRGLYLIETYVSQKFQRHSTNHICNMDINTGMVNQHANDVDSSMQRGVNQRCICHLT